MAVQTIHHLHDRKLKRPNDLRKAVVNSAMFVDKDQDMYAALYFIDKSPYTDYEVALGANVSPSTVNGWRMGKTIRPQNRTLRAVFEFLGIHRPFADRDGNILTVPGYRW